MVHSAKQPGGTSAILEMYRARQVSLDTSKSKQLSCRSPALSPLLITAQGEDGFGAIQAPSCPPISSGQLGGGKLRSGSAAEAYATEGAELDRLSAVIQRDGGGRTYAGMPSNWGQDFTVGAVPVYQYLESRDVDEVGYTLRTASLMTDPEYYFDERDRSDYRLFGIRYLILPTSDQPPVRARLAMRSGPYSLWMIDGTGYVQAARSPVTSRRTGRTLVSAASRCLIQGSRTTARISASGTAPAVAGMTVCPRCEASPPPARSARKARTSMTARQQRRCKCAAPELRSSAPPPTPDGRQP